MLKKYFSVIMTLVFLTTLVPTFFYTQETLAYENSTYFKTIKIGLVSMSSTSLKLTLNGDYTINNKVYASGSTLNLLTDGTNLILNGSIQSNISIVPNNQSNLLCITLGTNTNSYMGNFSFQIYNKKILPINIIDIESYLKGVVGYEMSDSCPIEALKAQTISARNYALSRIGWESSKGYDFDDTASYQVYKGFNPSYKNVINAVEQTKGQVLLYNDKLVEALYSAWHGGFSEDSENVWGNYVPYLRSVQDPYENDAWPNGNIILTSSQIQSILVSKAYLSSNETFLNLDLNSITKFPSGRVSNINIIYKNSSGSIQTKSITKDLTRTFLSLPSNLYTLTYNPLKDEYIFSGKGNGHGLGMSQIGAKNRANDGQTYDKILKFYYQNTTLQNLILKATISSLTQSTNYVYLGNQISFSISASNGNGYGYLYKYIIKNGSNTVVYTSDYNANSNLNYICNSPGNYTVETYVKDKFSISDYDDKRTSTFSVYNPQLSNINVSGYFYEGKTINFNANSTGTSPLGFYYRYEILANNNLLVSTDYTTSANFTFTPSTAGIYSIKVYGKDALSTKIYDSLKQFNITINSKPLYLSNLPLSYGMSNNDVISLQNALIKLSYPISSATGYFGSQTQSAVISFQNSNKFTPDGIVGNLTYSALNDSLIQKSGIINISY